MDLDLQMKPSKSASPDGEVGQAEAYKERLYDISSEMI